MSEKRASQGRALFYTRDSGGKHETTPARYVEWACAEAVKLGLSFSGLPETIESMIRANESHRGDIFLDFDVCGNQLSRPGFRQLLDEVANDRRVSHIFIPRRDRLARPDDPMDGVQMENDLRRAQVTLVFRNKVLSPIACGSRQDIAELLMGVIDYDKAGLDRRQLAEKVLLTKLTLARGGYATGGRPRYGFRRWLMRGDGTLVRELMDGERVRMQYHHVVWLPLPLDHPQMVVIWRILDLIEQMPARRIAMMLTAEGVPTPDAGRMRTDGGITHFTSGVWHSNTVTSIASNELLAAICTFGRRSIGDQLRFTPAGPRELTEADKRADGKPKVIRNDDSILIHAPAHFDQIIAPDRKERIGRILKDRGATQRGKARSQDPARNPLGARVVDMDCGWPMYRAPDKAGFRYVCGLYTQSSAQKCSHNHVDGPLATEFVLSCARQKALTPHIMPRLKRRLQEIIGEESLHPNINSNRKAKESQLAELVTKIAVAKRNMALAENDGQFKAMAEVFDQLTAQKVATEAEISKMAPERKKDLSLAVEVEKALELLEVLRALAADGQDYAKAGQLFGLLNARLFVAFKPEQTKKRILRRIAGGVVTFGAANPPVAIYEGPTARKRVKSEQQAAVVAAGLGAHGNALPDGMVPGREGKSSGNVSRGDMIRTCDLCVPNAALLIWEICVAECS